MDQIDRTLLNLLIQDSRTPTVTLAQKLGVARATVQNRISRLVSNRIIKRFTVEFDENYSRRVIRAITMIRIQPGQAKRITPTLKKIPQITRILSVSAPYDYIVETVVDELTELDKIVAVIRDIDGIQDTQTSIVLDG